MGSLSEYTSIKKFKNLGKSNVKNREYFLDSDICFFGGIIFNRANLVCAALNLIRV